MKKVDRKKIKNALILVCLIGACVLLNLGVFSGRFFWDIEVRKSADGYITLSEPEDRSAYDWCTATDECLYFSYSGQNGGVDVYSIEGKFLYWLYFDDIDKGSIYLRSEDNLVYIMLRNGAVYVFDGTELVARYSDTEASNKGFDIWWFREETQKLEVTNTYIYFLDADGNQVGQIVTPYNVHYGESASNMRQAHPVEIIAILLVFIVGYGMIIRGFVKDARRK